MNWVRINKLSELTGLTEDAVRGYYKKGIWQQGKLWVKRNNCIWFNTKAIEKWVEGKVQ